MVPALCWVIKWNLRSRGVVVLDGPSFLIHTNGRIAAEVLVLWTNNGVGAVSSRVRIQSRCFVEVSVPHRLGAVCRSTLGDVNSVEQTQRAEVW